jgi:uncharacterized protein YbjT (DUF2867 family)
MSRCTLVIGSTGNIGRHVVNQLAACGETVRALARNPDQTQFPPRVEVVSGDLTRPETLNPALDGVDAVFLVWVAPPVALPPALERITHYARRIVFLSSPYKTPHPFFQQPNQIRVLHAEIEKLIVNSGKEWSFLRPGMLASNALLWWVPQIRAGNVVRWPYANAPTAPTHEADIAAVAVRALIDDDHTGAEYVLTGPESLTQAQQVETIGAVLGRPLRLEEISPETAQRELLAIIPAPAILQMLLDAWAAAVGQPAFVTSTIQEIAGRPAHTFREWASEHASAFQS